MNIGNTKVWLITDMHINHENIKRFCNRPDDYVDQIKASWKEKVSDNDIVIDLGDVIFKQASTLSEHIADLPGLKVLIMGNHDHYNYTWYMNQGYDFVCDGFNWFPIAFSHHPLVKLPDKCSINIHGHLHNNPYDNPYDWFKQEDWHVLLALEHEGYGPILLEDFLKKKGFSLDPLRR